MLAFRKMFAVTKKLNRSKFIGYTFCADSLRSAVASVVECGSHLYKYRHVMWIRHEIDWLLRSSECNMCALLRGCLFESKPVPAIPYVKCGWKSISAFSVKCTPNDRLFLLLWLYYFNFARYKPITWKSGTDNNFGWCVCVDVKRCSLYSGPSPGILIWLQKMASKPYPAP